LAAVAAAAVSVEAADRLSFKKTETTTEFTCSGFFVKIWYTFWDALNGFRALLNCHPEQRSKTIFS
jgi:hypothetical protein